MLFTPLDQFQSYTYLPILFCSKDYLFFLPSFFLSLVFTTNQLFLFLFSILIVFFFYWYPNFFLLFSPRLYQIAVLNFFGSSLSQFLSQGNLGLSAKFYPLSLSLFFFLVNINLIGLFPLSFTVTSQLFLNLVISFSLFFFIIFESFTSFGLNFVYKFIPSGVPTFILPVIFIIEIFSFFVRPVSLALRLFANMVAGHVLLFVFSGFSIIFLTKSVLLFFFSYSVIFFIFLLECFVCLLQAYVFFILFSIYLGESQ